MVSSSQYPHLFILYLHLPTLVLSLLRHCHSHHGNEDPVANDSDGVMFSCVGVDCRWLVHADNLFSEGLHVMGWTECTKLFLEEMEKNVRKRKSNPIGKRTITR